MQRRFANGTGESGFLLPYLFWGRLKFENSSEGTFRGDDPATLRNDVSRRLDTAQVSAVLLDSVAQGFSYLLPIVRRFEQLFVSRVADERNLRKDGRHVRPNQHDERSLLHAAVLGGGASLLHLGGH
jgi:hypothetical protein